MGLCASSEVFPRFGARNALVTRKNIPRPPSDSEVHSSHSVSRGARINIGGLPMEADGNLFVRDDTFTNGTIGDYSP